MNNKKLICCSGLPGSGKTTWAMEQVETAPYYKARVNKDDIRKDLAFTGWVWSPKNEADVIRIRNNRIISLFNQGFTTIISDDTNFGRHRKDLKAIAQNCGAEFELKIFDTSIDECIYRDSLREGSAKVGEEVIRKMAKQYNIYDIPVFDKVTPNPDLPTAIICDLDGTLSLLNGRDPYDASTCDQDLINIPIVDCIDGMLLSELADKVIFLSGREDKYREQTVKFLSTIGPIYKSAPLFMRTIGDTRVDWIVKGELFNIHIRDKYNILFVLDDRNQVVKFWRSIGLTCFQVAEGDF